MTGVLVDTSALYAALDRHDVNHASAAAGWNALIDATVAGDARPCTHSSMLVESTALVQSRLGTAAVRVLHDDLLQLVDVVWVDRELHGRALAALLAADRREVSLVDWTSFEVMRALGLDHVFAFDDDFPAMGFALWSAAG